MKKWQHFLLAAFGASIPIVAYLAIFSLNQPGPIYFLAVTPVYIGFTLYLSQKTKDKSAKKIIGACAIAGFSIAAAFSASALLLPGSLGNIISCVVLLFPSCLFWMALDGPKGNITMGAIAIVYSTAIAANIVLYALYGCIIYYAKKLVSKNGVHQNARA